MTAISMPRPRILRQTAVSRRARLQGWLATHRRSLYIVPALLFVTAATHSVNFDGYPSRLNDDEGTYAAQAMAVLHDGQLSHYTYWYDHPPLGWMTIAGYAGLTGGFTRTATVVTMVREVMVLASVISAALLYVLLRRLHFSRCTASVAVLLFGLSPLAIFFHRLGFLDNLAVAWVLAALVLVASPQRSLGSVFGSAVCFAAAVLTKETAGILLPVLLWLLVQRHTGDHRGWALGVFLPTFFGISFAYPLYAILKNELFEGPGHVSLLWALKWQLMERDGTGSVLDGGSVTSAMARSWIDTDPWLLLGGAALVPVALWIRRLRPFGLALGLQLLIMCRGGYVPQAFVISLLPFAALLIAGTGEVFWRSRLITVAGRWAAARGLGGFVIRQPGALLVAATVVVFAVWGAPRWVSSLQTATTEQPSAYSRQATQWIKNNVSRDTTIVVDDNIWGDLKLAGYTHQIWVYKVDLDPAVNEKFLPNGYRDIKYVVLLPLPRHVFKNSPTLVQALDNSQVVTTFGEGNEQIIVRKVNG